MAYQVVEGLDVTAIAKRQADAGIHAIPVAESVPESGDERVEFEGTFDDYVVVLTALGVNHVLVYHIDLSDEDFQYGDSDEDGDGEDDGRPAVNLEEINSKLKRFRARVGQAELVHISAWLGYQHLYVELTSPWSAEYAFERAAAVRLVEQKIEAERSRESDEEDETVEKLLERLRVLDADPKMVKLKTQKAMLQYALQCNPELRDIDMSFLKTEIQDMRARIDVGSA